MGDIIGLVSGKGGVGKTTITACLGGVLSEQGYRVLLCDGDFGLRDLDLVLGKEDEVLFDALDAMADKDLTEEAIVEVREYLHLLPANQQIRWEEMGRKKYRKFVKQLAERYDYVLVDSPAGIGRGLESIMELVERVLIITQPLWVSLRNAARTIQFCRDYGHRDYAVVFNSLHPAAADLNLYDMLDVLGAEYVGAILSYETSIVESTQQGTLINAMSKQYKELLQPVVDYITTGDAWDEQDVLERYTELTTPTSKEIPVISTLSQPKTTIADDTALTFTNRWSTQQRVIDGKQSMWRRKRMK
ncbi:P-loop NTPase [Veillonella caviae]|uniref:P-loop NTPase n=1 Tax=Veillonella caviae TaxID=248316 RepID=UPI0023A8E01C|nr:P-loop NTPase [Veillonella caviae]MCI5709154.1 P-loop NTPase [Veillonella caviae]MDY5715057.1 P-loop NTPase [Veillonella caviae]